MIVEPRSSATILALAELADLSATQLEDGHSIEDVIATLRKAAETVRKVVKDDEDSLSVEAAVDGEDLVEDKVSDISA